MLYNQKNKHKKILISIITIISISFSFFTPTYAHAYNDSTEHLIVSSLIGLAIGTTIANHKHREHQKTYITTHVTQPHNHHRYNAHNRVHFYDARAARRQKRAEKKAKKHHHYHIKQHTHKHHHFRKNKKQHTRNSTHTHHHHIYHQDKTIVSSTQKFPNHRQHNINSEHLGRRVHLH